MSVSVSTGAESLAVRTDAASGVVLCCAGWGAPLPPQNAGLVIAALCWSGLSTETVFSFFFLSF